MSFFSHFSLVDQRRISSESPRKDSVPTTCLMSVSSY